MIDQSTTPMTKIERLRAFLRRPGVQLMLYIETGLLMLVGFWMLPGGFDFLVFFHKLARGCETCTYNPYFTEWFLAPFGLLEWREGYLVLCAVSIALLWWSARQLGGSAFAALVSGTFIWVLWLGQIDILPAFGLALAWWALQRERRILAGVGLLLLATKPQLGGFAILLLAYWGGPRSLIVPLIAEAASVVVYGLDWPLRWLGFTPQTVFGGDAWFYISTPWLLVTLLATPFIRGRREQLHYVIAATTLGAPYLGGYSLFVLLLFRARWWEITIGYLPFVLMSVTNNQWWLGLLLLQPLLMMARLLRENFDPALLHSGLFRYLPLSGVMVSRADKT